MRVLFLGTTGINKEEVLKSIADIALKEKFQLTTGIDHQHAGKYIRIYDVDKKISQRLGMGFTQFMDGKVRDQQRETWKHDMKHILDEIDFEKPEHIFLSVHGAYYRYGNYFSLIDTDLLEKFQPNIIITLIDDIYDVSDKVTRKEASLITNSSCTLAEALSWRTIEIMVGDNTSDNLFVDPQSIGLSSNELENLPEKIRKLFKEKIPHFVLAVKHPPRMFFRLLFERKRLVLYSSFPITSTRDDPSKIDEINQFKERLSENFTVLDPSTIDELVFKNKNELDSNKYKNLKENGIILQEEDNVLIYKRLHGNFSRSINYPSSLNAKELASLEDSIKKQVEKRDYRMVSQSEGVVAYRPFWGGRPDPSGGVDAELTYANSIQRGVFAYHPNQDGDPNTLFRGVDVAIVTSNLDELFDQLTQHQSTKNSETTIETWE